MTKADFVFDEAVVDGEDAVADADWKEYGAGVDRKESDAIID